MIHYSVAVIDEKPFGILDSVEQVELQFSHDVVLTGTNGFLRKGGFRILNCVINVYIR